MIVELLSNVTPVKGFICIVCVISSGTVSYVIASTPSTISSPTPEPPNFLMFNPLNRGQFVNNSTVSSSVLSPLADVTPIILSTIDLYSSPSSDRIYKRLLL